MRLEPKSNRKYQPLSDEDFANVMKEFTKRGYQTLEPKPGMKVFNKKVIPFTGENLPKILILRNASQRPTNSLMIHPLTPTDHMKFSTVSNKGEPYFYNADAGFPILPGRNPTSAYFRALFHSELELGRILDNLIEIERGETPESFSEAPRGKTGKAESVGFLPDSPASDLVTEVVTEGGKKLIFTYKYERNPRLKKKALEEYGYSCSVCGFDFEETYGSLGKEFTEVHHIVPVSEGERENDYRNLVPLCPNCHRMIHRLYKDLMPQQYGDAVEILRNKLKR